MTASNYEKLENNRKETRNRLMKIMIYGFLIIIVLVLIFAFWISQPLLSNSKISKPLVKVDKSKLETHVRRLSEDFHPRNFANFDKLDETARYIKDAFETSGGEVIEQTFLDGKNEYKNIIAKYGKKSSERIVIGAHYDSCFDTPGADDNASGIAGLIELAKLFGENEPPMQIELVAYTLEEPPFFSTEQMGSFIHAKSLKDEGVLVRLMISLEMIGYFSDQENSQSFPFLGLKLLYPKKGNFISIVGNFTNILTTRRLKGLMSVSTDLPVYSINAPAKLPGIDFSDHKNYWHFGYDAIMITDTAFFRNKNYHTKNDTADTLDYERMAKVIEASYFAVSTIAQE